jgi:hypothetical protein
VTVGVCVAATIILVVLRFKRKREVLAGSGD